MLTHRHLLFVVVCISVSSPVFCQTENDVWPLSNNTKLDFSSGSPVLINSSPLYTSEGIASISDTSGQLLFYTDGTTVWNNQDAVMSNGTGLLGDQSSTQSALILPDPGNSQLYYLFTSDQGGYFTTNKGIHYSIVDMTLNAGLGDVIPAMKNIALDTSTGMTEKLTAIRHCNGRDWWVITHPFNSNAIYAHLLTPYGIQPPVVSFIGTPNIDNGTQDYAETIGYIEPSAQGNRMALCLYGDPQPFVDVFDFDNSTGFFSNPLTITFPGMGGGISKGAYGASFSPNGNELYVSWIDEITGDSSYLFQFDATQTTSASLMASRFRVAAVKVINYNGPYYGAIEAAPDGKLYTTGWGFHTVDVINSPDLSGAACNYTTGINTGGVAQQLGLPNFPDAWNYYGNNSMIPDPGNDTLVCNSNVTLSVVAPPGAGVLWSTGDTTSSLTVSQTGNYWVQFTGFCAFPVADSIFVTVNTFSQFDITNDTITCNMPVQLTATTSPGAAIVWNTGDTSATLTVVSSGTFWATGTVPGCPALSDTAEVTIDSVIRTHLPEEINSCTGENLTLSAAYDAETFLWSTGETTSSIIVNTPGTYWVEAGSQYCPSVTDSVTVNLGNCECDIYIPNAFTPNEDGINETFYAVPVCDVRDYSFFVFDRWGNLIYQSNDPVKGWDGTFHNQNCEEDVYVYRVSGNFIYSDGTSKFFSRTGHIALIR